ncbi:MAG: UbiH/UbiF/VisC/COQ6 family ubiquinone biosynthesis hydroxylase [Gammaproteobacteria bacterium]|jgi:2-octaprenylphenol hydroxylase
MTERYDVIIAGGGMVGATLACALGQGGLRVAVLEQQAPRPFHRGDDYDLRVSAISRASQRIFEHLGVWPLLSARRISPYLHMCVWDAGGSGEIRFDSLDVGESCLGHIIENRVIQDALHQRLKDFQSVDVLLHAALEDFEVGADEVQVTLGDGRTLTARLLVGADGARSRVRERARIEWRVQPYDQLGVVATVTTEKPHQATAWQRFLPTGPLAFLPLADGRCSIVWSADTARAEDLMQLSDEDFIHQLGQAFGYKLGRITAVSPRAAFPLRGAQAAHYVKERVALIGDAAHTIHPLAGQGANLGFLDAAALAETLLGCGRDIGSLRVLRGFERSRRGENILMMRAMEGFKRLFGNRIPPLMRLRNWGLGMVDAAPPLKKEFIRQAMGLGGDLPQLARGNRE